MTKVVNKKTSSIIFEIKLLDCLNLWILNYSFYFFVFIIINVTFIILIQNRKSKSFNNTLVSLSNAFLAVLASLNYLTSSSSHILESKHCVFACTDAVCVMYVSVWDLQFKERGAFWTSYLGEIFLSKISRWFPLSFVTFRTVVNFSLRTKHRAITACFSTISWVLTFDRFIHEKYFHVYKYVYRISTKDEYSLFLNLVWDAWA